VHEEPRNVAALLLLSRVHAEMARYPDALEAAERALRIDSRNRSALELGSALAFRLGNRTRAVTLAERLLVLAGEEDNPIARHIVAASRIVPRQKVGLATPPNPEQSE
jgi:cytochrome c-type biogenesis protein CcmH/NrfG